MCGQEHVRSSIADHGIRIQAMKESTKTRARIELNANRQTSFQQSVSDSEATQHSNLVGANAIKE